MREEATRPSCRPASRRQDKLEIHFGGNYIRARGRQQPSEARLGAVSDPPVLGRPRRELVGGLGVPAAREGHQAALARREAGLGSIVGHVCGPKLGVRTARKRRFSILAAYRCGARRRGPAPALSSRFINETQAHLPACAKESIGSTPGCARICRTVTSVRGPARSTAAYHASASH